MMEISNNNPMKRLLLSPEDFTLFNSARLLLLLKGVDELGIEEGVDLERLSYYDFFAANPFLMIMEDDPSRIDLEVAGFETHTIEYISSSQRYRTKRSHLKQYLSVLLAKELIDVSNTNRKLYYKITQNGIEYTNEMKTMYACAYKESVLHIIKKLKRLSDKRLWEEASKWLEAKSFQVDLYDMLGEKHE